MSILIKGIPLAGYEISIMKDGERYRARVDGIWCEVEEIPTADTDSDTISRKAAIDALRMCYDTETITMDNGDEYIDYGDAVNEIEQLPPAQPEHIKGRWVEKPHVHGVAYCSLCDYELHTNDTNFCPNCGADMKEVTE